MATKKLQWSRDHIMQHQEGGGTQQAACWAAVIESALAYYAKSTGNTSLGLIEQQFMKSGGEFGGHGIKDFVAALTFYKLYADHRKGAQKFQGKYPQVFNFVKKEIDKGNPVLLGLKLKVIGARHAGMVFGYDEPDKVFFIEPARLAMKNAAGAFELDTKIEDYYLSNAVTVEALFTNQVLRPDGAGPALIMEVQEVYQIKAPNAAAKPAGGAGKLVATAHN